MKKIVLMGLLGMLAIGHAFGQGRTVTGTVTSEEDGSPLPGVNVVFKGTTSGTVTDVAGKYVLNVPAEGGTIIFSLIGSITKEVEITERSGVDYAHSHGSPHNRQV